MSVTIDVLADPARACAALMVGAALGEGHIVLTGGSTPKVAYGHFADAAQTVGIDLGRTTLWLGDERCVEPDDDRSNFKMIKESLLDPLGDNQPTTHRIRGELGPEAGADDYEEQLRDAGTPTFDLLLLGLGPDGHCASLFPHQDTLDERSRLVVGVPEAGLEPFVPRVSFTIPTLVRSQHIVFLATGASKADAVAKAFGPTATPDPATPASLLAPEARQITVLLDEAAASRLGTGAGR